MPVEPVSESLILLSLTPKGYDTILRVVDDHTEM